MSAKYEALRLADELGIPHQCDFHIVCEEAAAELRRLYAENLQLKKDCDGLLTIVKEWEADAAMWDNISDQRDALLEALRDLVQLEADGSTEYASSIRHWDAARAAIAKAEGEKP